MEQEHKSKEQKVYDYHSYPENIRQVGEVNGQKRIYIEDYVLTDIRRIFREKQEEAIVIFLGKEGYGETKDSLFIYGSIDVELDMESGDMQEEQWNKLYEGIHKYFPGAKVLGWGFGVGLWTSRIDRQVRRIQEEQFGEMGQILFLSDLSEKEEKVFLYEDSAFEELPGYYIYFAKNPQMQDYMLRDQKTESFETGYADQVTKSIRTAIKKKRTKQEQLQLAMWGAGIALFLIMLLGANMLVESMEKINSMEETIQTLSNYVTASKDSDMVISHALENGSLVENTAEPSATPEGTAAVTQSPQQSNGTATKSPVEKDAAATKSPEKATAGATKSPANTMSPSSKAAKSSKKSVDASRKSVSASNKKMQSYIVKEGDTLSQIVWKQYHSFRYMDKVRDVNNIENCDEIYVGQRILLPEP
ncbi:MAG: LysM peptidoglycan-binding domain-containing protein [Lachnospiraceae bacterium]|nr:LysM peptidoglycan-binding domain-containing protein [Lachnospiraceae bacterium]